MLDARQDGTKICPLYRHVNINIRHGIEIRHLTGCAHLRHMADCPEKLDLIVRITIPFIDRNCQQITQMRQLILRDIDIKREGNVILGVKPELPVNGGAS